MVIIWLSVVLIGFSFGALSAIPTGPVGVLIIRDTLQGTPRAALATMAGLAVAQFLYVVVLIVGLEGWIFSRPLLWHSVASVGALIVLALGFKTLLSLAKSLGNPSRADGGAVAAPEMSYRGHAATSFTITLTNPAVLFVYSSTVSFYTSIFGQIPDSSRLVVYLFSVLAGVLCWFLVLIALLSRLVDKPAVRVRVQKYLEHVSGWVLTAFGVYLLVREAVALFNSIVSA